MSFGIPGMSVTQERAIFTAGLALQAVQSAEFNLDAILTWNFPKQAPFDLVTFDAMSTANQKSTLGRLLSDLRKRANIEPTFDMVLESFVADRNRFVHHLFTEEGCALATDAGAERATTFMLRLIGDAGTVQHTLVSFMVCWAQTSGDPKLVRFANELIQIPDRPYNIITGSENVFCPKPKT